MKKIENKTNAIKRIEKTYDMPIEELLNKMYKEQGMIIRDISEELLISPKTVWSWMQQAGISCRKMKWE